MANKTPNSKAQSGRALRRLRKQAGLSLQELADLCGVHISMISKWELGHRTLSADSFAHVQEAIAKGRIKKLAERMFAAKTAEQQKALLSEITEAEKDAVYDLMQGEVEKERTRTLKAESNLEHAQRAALHQIFEKPIDVNPALRALIVEKFFSEPEFRDFYRKEYERFYVAHPELPHLTQEQVAEIRGRANKSLEESRTEMMERKRQLMALENAQSIDDPIIQEIMESFRREIAEKDELLSRMLSKKESTNADD